MFFGRDEELQQLHDLFQKSTSSMVICRGRRRIGKSTLIRQFAEKNSTFLEFQGLPPREGITREIQLREIGEQLSKQTRIPPLNLESWTQAFPLLASQINKNENTVILLDEISWMAIGEPDFPGKLKNAWDTLFKKYPKLVMVLCGSVSSWIDKNILNNTGFVGRISLDLFVQELPLYYCNHFWKSRKGKISSLEKAKILSVTGGVPKYLEEINPAKSAEDNIKRLCFSKAGMLNIEFENTFKSLFNRRNPIYRQILASLAEGRKTLTEVSKMIGRGKSGDLSGYLQDLEKSGFVKNDSISSLQKSGLARNRKYRLSDNYIRFYLKYIDPEKPEIDKGLYKNTPLEQIINWDTVLGLQFENLILNNIPEILKKLEIDNKAVKTAGSYFQRKTARQESCQIDLLISTRYSIYVCEIKCGHSIGSGVMNEVREKMIKLKAPKGVSIRPVLIYEGQITRDLSEAGFFDEMICFEELLSKQPA